MRGTWGTVAAVLLAGAMADAADLKVAEIFRSGMVIQRDTPVPVWGTADPGAKVAVRFKEETVDAVADENGAWRADLPPTAFGGPWTMTVAGERRTHTFADVYVGDVWLCGGQSNMQWKIERSDLLKGQAEGPDDPLLRAAVGHYKGWAAADGPAREKVTAVGYFFGRALRRALPDVPIGLIDTSEGGTSAEQWMDPSWSARHGVFDPAVFYKLRIQPLQPYALKGVIWYQGENNVWREDQYVGLMDDLIAGWRADWGQGDFPFLYAQLPRIGHRRTPAPAVPGAGWAKMREAQTRTLRNARTGMAVIFDTSDGDLHPPEKRPVGERLARIALADVYGLPLDVPAMSPLFKAIARDGDRARITFDHAPRGLAVMPDENGDVVIRDLNWWIDGKSVPVAARIEDGALVVDMAGIEGAPDLYYGWNDFPQGNLYTAPADADALPVSPFRVVSARFTPARAEGDAIELVADRDLDPARTPALVDPAAYAVTDRAVAAVRATDDPRRLRLTLDRPLATGDRATVTFPGLRLWDGQTPHPGRIGLVALPGTLAAGALTETMLFTNQPEAGEAARAGESPIAGDVWTPMAASAGRFDFARLYGRVPEAEGFAHVYVYADTERKVQLWMGSQPMVTAFVNGVECFKSERGHGLAPDQERARDVPLRAGWNSVLLAVKADARGHWACALRLMDEHGGPPAGLAYQAERP